MRQLISKFARRFRPSVHAAAPAAEGVESLEGRRLLSSSLAYGINANAVSSGNYSKIVHMLHDTGTKTIRMWLNVNSYSSRHESGIFKYIRRFANDGFDLTVTVDPPHNGSDDGIRSCFRWLAEELGGSVDRWQVGNEVDKEFGDLKGYVNNILRPASQGLRSQGEKVVSGAVSYDPDDIRTMVNAGMLNYVDFVGYHPYRKSVEDLRKAVAEVKEIANGKPLVATEWNVRGDEGNKTEWAQEIKEFWPTIRDNFYAAYYFAAVKVNSMAGPAAVITGSGSPNGAFYSTYKSLKNNFGSGPATPDPSQPSTPSGRPATNVPNTAGKPTVGGFRIFDGITGQVIKGYENVTGNVTIKLKALKHRQIQIRALVSSNTQSVKFSFSGRGTRTESNAPYTLFAAKKTGNASPWSAAKGKYALAASAHTADGAKGTAGATKSLTLTFV